MSTIIIISQPTKPPAPPAPPAPAEFVGIDVQADGIHTFQPHAAPTAYVGQAEDQNSAPSRTASHNAALRALNEAFATGATVRVIDA